MTMNIDNPQGAMGCKFEELSPGTTYYFRLVARNPKGMANGKPTSAITTLGMHMGVRVP